MLCLLTFASVCVCGLAIVRIPAGLGMFDSPYVNASTSLNETFRMKLLLDNVTFIPFSRVPLGSVRLGDLALMDPRINFHRGRGFIAHLAIGRNSFLRRQFGPAAFTRSELVLNSSSSEFLSTCVSESYFAIPLNSSGLDQWNGTIESEGQTTAARFKLEALPAGMLITFPQNLAESISDRMVENNGGIEIFRRSVRGIREIVLVDCAWPDSLAGLPDMVVRFNEFGALVLSPEDYIFHDDSNRECFFRFGTVNENVHYSFNPLELRDANLRVSNDLLEICDAVAA